MDNSIIPMKTDILTSYARFEYRQVRLFAERRSKLPLLVAFAYPVAIPRGDGPVDAG